MKKIEISNGDVDVSILINRIKVLFGDNYSAKYKILKTLEQYIEKESNTEFNKETNSIPTIKINDSAINTSNSAFIKINSNFDLDNDIKLGTKSLILKYLESSLENIEYTDMFNSLKKLMISLTDEISDEHNIKMDNAELSIGIGEFTLKKLIKLFDVEIKTDDMVTNQYNLSYKDIIKIQLRLVKSIAEKNVNKNYFVCIDSYIDDELLDTIYHYFTADNIFCFIFSNINYTNIKLEDVLLVNNSVIDLADEVSVYNELIMNFPFHVEKREFDSIVAKYLNGVVDDRIIELKSLL